MHWLLLAALTVAAPAQAPDAEADRQWAVSTSRMLGAAGTVRDRAWRLQQTTTAVVETGRAGGMSAIVADAVELDRAVISAVLAAESLARTLPQGEPDE